ncbi:MAG: ChbG/HpnK family deacetylase, partial [Burkholderiaceae bacterium]
MAGLIKMRNTRNVKQLIINADDFGWDIDSCKATIDCMETGSVTSATIMTGRPATDMACEYAAENAHRFSFGLHFNIVDQHKPLAKNPASLIDHGSHAFRDSDQQRKLALLGGLKAEDLQNELMAQIEELKQKKVKISHIDSHGHMHKFPCIISALKPTLLQNNIHRVRRPQNLYGQGSKMSTKIINAASTPFFKSLTSTNYLLTVSSYESNWFNRLL